MMDTEMYFKLKKLGASDYQAARTERMIRKFKVEQIKSLSDGWLYKELVLAGVNPIEARLTEVYHWAEYDKRIPATPYEKGLIAFAEGKSKLKYNEVVNNGTMMQWAEQQIVKRRK